MENYTHTTHKTFSNVLKTKLVDHIEALTLQTIFRQFVLIICGITFGIIIAFPDRVVEALEFGMEWGNGASLKIFLSVFVFANLKYIIGIFDMIQFDFGDETDQHIEGGIIEGIPTYELIDHLFNNGSFKRTEIENKFGIPRNRYQKLAEHLEELSILVRGANNARILNEDVSRQELAAMLDGVSDTHEVIRKPHNAGGGKWTFGNIGSTIRERVHHMTAPHHTTAEM